MDQRKSALISGKNLGVAVAFAFSAVTCKP
jgi:hypothetical protein